MRTHNGFIQELKDNEVFVFGSNLSGIHGKGAAKTAKKWGAKNGQGEGLYGKTYALPTVKEKIRGPLSIGKIRGHVELFIDCVKRNPDKDFLLTEVGCGLAGHKVFDIACLFERHKDVPNIVWPEPFVKVFEALNRDDNDLNEGLIDLGM